MDLEKLTIDKLTSSSLLWLPDRSSWLEAPCSSNRSLLEEVTILDSIILEDPDIILKLGSKISPAGTITTSLGTSPSGRHA